LSDYCFRHVTHIKSLYRAIYIKTMFCSSLAPLVCRRVRVLLMLLVFVANIGVQHVLIIWVTCRLYYKSQDLLILREYMSSSPFVEGSLPLIFLGFLCCPIICVFGFWVPYCDVRYDFRIKMMFGSSFPPVLVSFLRYLCLFVHSGVQHILCCVFLIFFLCTLCYQFLSIVHFECPLIRCSLTFLFFNMDSM
jgi:hypothetical protein